MFDGANFNGYFSSVPVGVLSNVLLSPQPLQYTTSDGIISPVSQTTLSSKIVVIDKYFKGSTSIGRKIWNQFHISLKHGMCSTLNMSCISYGNP